MWHAIAYDNLIIHPHTYYKGQWIINMSLSTIDHDDIDHMISSWRKSIYYIVEGYQYITLLKVKRVLIYYIVEG